MKTEVYSWRLSSGLKSDLERVARRRKVSVSSVLETAVREWLGRNAQDVAGDEEQKRLHAIADRFIGSISGDNPHRATTASAIVRKNLRRRYGR